ncbi:hypothetical protein CK203_112184 [Vitis vinifera]|uniref:Reverse transcriptase domain-containing protein n=1 Tax=Vitis vinifera TaxID=29760 RepID=A0A438CSL7_VITVI|nr:hypothetical protein CK203_112184 [Vitis vinifera]
MNFISYVAEFSREWGEPNARDMGRMTSQPKAKGEMYILNDGMDMKVKIAAMERRLEELEKNQMQEMQAISQTPLQAMLCAICQSFEHLVEECPIIPVARDMLEINSQLHQKIENVESSQLRGWMKCKNDLSQKIDNLQDSISKVCPTSTQCKRKKTLLLNLIKIKRVSMKWRLRKGDKEVDLPTCKLKHKEESETEKEKREEIKGKKNGKSKEEDGYDVNVQGAPQRIVIKEEMMKNHIPPPFPKLCMAPSYKASLKVLLYDSKLHLFSGGKLKSSWTGPFIVHEVHPNGVVEIFNPIGNQTFKVNGRRLKPFIEPYSTDKEEINLLEPPQL